MSDKFYFLGGGGFALELYEYMLSDGIKVEGYYGKEDNLELSKFIPWMGDIDTIEDEKLDKDAYYLVAVRLLKYREKMFETIKNRNLKAGTYISKKAYFSKIAKIGKGAVVFPFAMISGNAQADNYLFMDTYSIISHGDIIGQNVVVGPAAIITGDCVIGNNVTFGVNSSVLPGTKIGDNTEIAINTYPQRRVADNSRIISMPGKNFGININKNFKN